MIETAAITADDGNPIAVDVDIARIGAVYRCSGDTLAFNPAAVTDLQINGLPVVDLTIRRALPSYLGPVAVKYEMRVGFNRKPTAEQIAERQRVDPFRNWAAEDYSGLPD